MVADVVVSSIKSFPDATSLALVSDLQFNEPYSSAALNRKFRGIVNPGFYGGFLPSPAGGLNLKISSGEEGGTASINIDKYYQMTVRQQADVTMPVTAGKKVIVVLEATYALGQETYQVNCKSAVQAAEIKFLEEGTALRQNQLELCTVTVPAGAPELTEEMIDISRRLNKTVGITLSGAIDSDADHIGASSHAVKKAVKAARDETEKQIEELVDNAPASLDTLKKIADAINNDPDFFNTLNAVLALKAPLHDPALTGIATVPTPPLSVSNKQIANTEFVQAAVAALVGSSPEALDTLAELAEALGNDPNFATTMLNKLAGKQPLDNTLTNLSGKDVAGLIQYLGLVETINKAAGSLQKDQNGADVPQPDWFVRNIGAARAFSGTVSIGGGGNWTTADFIVWLESQGAFNHPYWMCKGSWSYGDNRTITDTGCGNISLAGSVVEVMGVRGAMTIRITTPTTTAGNGTPSAQFIYINHGDGYLPGWHRDFNTANPPYEYYPVGSPIPWPLDTPPANHALMQGQAFNKSAYPLLAVAYPSGVIPDMRSQTIKGKPDGRAVLSQELDGIKSHDHGATVASTDLGNRETTGFDYGNKSVSAFDYGTKSTNSGGEHAHALDVYYLNTSQQAAKVGAGGQWAGGVGTQGTYAGGAHAHSVGIGAHDHIVGIGAHAHSVYIGAHSHGVTVSPSGHAENTVKNTAFNYLVRLA
ncbi:tail fiber protein [Citrobacter freundii]|uniref:tail fiber protein n=1 Tax=Citrobacter freundii TaxID=546 RepID=UPI00214D3F53|nr:tail fiber protein [Citrobacter freundii]MCR3717555.1 tail fiber protein [Citrobacter freundii]